MRNNVGIFYRSRPGRCTFCGSRAGSCQTAQGKHRVCCPSCGNHTKHDLGTRRRAVTAWNLGQNIARNV